MRGTKRLALAAGAVLVLVAGAGCSSGDGSARKRSETSRPAKSRQHDALPPPVRIRPEPEGVTLEDPAFEPLPHARADFGRLGGTVYEIEMPQRWNGRLVLEMHGFGEFAPEVNASPPDFRRYLIAQGIAWGASSFSSSSLIPGRAADETAALWDHFARKYGRPTWTYITGWSMGGAATHVAAERYANRFDGALAFCGAAGQTAALDITADFVAAGAYVAGVRQADYDASPDLGALVRDRIRPALRDPKLHEQFEDIVIDLTGGPRAFDREGILDEEETNWRRGTLEVVSLTASNRDRRYRLGPASSVTSADFNRDVIRFRVNDALRRTLLEGSEITGEIRMPMLTIHTTGDGQVPIEQARILNRKVEAAGKRRLLVQRVIEDTGHCGFTTDEMEAGLDAIVAWVERGVKPTGTNVMVDDLRRLRPTFERLPRMGTPEGDAVRGARDRAVLHGHLTLDGAALDARFLGAVVLRDGLSSPCQLNASPITNGTYEITVAADAEVSGCGGPGAAVVLWTFAQNQRLFSRETVAWPTDADATFDANFATSAPLGAAHTTTDFAGGIYRPDGRHLPAGTKVEAYIGDTLCGVGSVRRTGSFLGYILDVAGPDSVAGCTRGGSIEFRVDGRPAVETVVNSLRADGGLTDLTLR